MKTYLQIADEYAKDIGYTDFKSLAKAVNIVPRDVRSIAESYAKQQAIAFHKWADTVAVRSGLDHWGVGSGPTTKYYTSAQLYTLFIEHQNKNLNK